MLVKNNLGFHPDLKIFQDKTMFNYSVDTILLGNFVTIKNSTHRVLDLGANNGALSIFVAMRKRDLQIDALEIQKSATILCQKNVEINNLETQIKVINDDFKLFYQKHCQIQSQKYDLIMVNPPFFKVNQIIKKNFTQEMLIAKTELKISLKTIIAGAAKIINQKGYLTLVHKVDRLVEVIILMKRYGFEPKRIQMIVPRTNERPKLFLIESRYQSGAGLEFLENLVLHTNNRDKHEYNEFIKKLYVPIKGENEK